MITKLNYKCPYCKAKCFKCIINGEVKVMDLFVWTERQWSEPNSCIIDFEVKK